MKIAHVALWTRRLEELRAFYAKYFGAASGEKYVNAVKGFESYFLRFDGDASLEIIRSAQVTEPAVPDRIGWAHLAFGVADREAVRALTERMRRDGITVAGEPRQTGDGCYESVVLDPDGNRIEIVVG
ncbi:MAG: VOC family protein [Rikenellaceae bacterium]|nr:VOC family protein [Rikenellaceae bacterium]